MLVCAKFCAKARLNEEIAMSTFFAWIGGVATTTAGAWVSSRFHNYQQEWKEHRDDLREKVLQPTRMGLVKYISPFVCGKTPILVTEHAATGFDFEASVTVDPEKYGPVLVAKFPTASVFGPIDSALLHDVRTNHLPQLFAKFDHIDRDWMAYCADCHIWAMRLARKIQERSGLLAFPAADPRGPYVMHYRLAVFLYMRLFRFPTGAIQKEEKEMHPPHFWLKGGSYTLAVGSSEQMDALIAHLNKLQQSETEAVSALRDRAGALHSRYINFLEELDYAIATRQLPGRCEFVKFFSFP